ncbi:ComEA family DNA-binding protein [Nocardia sp. NPDC048505]|uniref:ComEA family DNA-binding protein n=1 Tax=Nocardia sp. NPDC048505 TaxID=3155756 RepID=UPI0033E1BB79
MTQPVPPLAALHSTSSRPPSESSADKSAAGSAESPNTGTSGTPAPAAELVVSVVGLVHRPGLVHLPTGSRVADAITAAGGTTPEADLTGLNLAQRLLDGDQVLLGPTRAAATPGTPQLGSGTLSTGSPNPATNNPAASPTSRLNINTATETELDTLPGIGPITARAIITWRTTNGPFTDVTQLGEVDGIGPARLARLRDLVRI